LPVLGKGWEGPLGAQQEQTLRLVFGMAVVVDMVRVEAACSAVEAAELPPVGEALLFGVEMAAPTLRVPLRAGVEVITPLATPTAPLVVLAA
jgi:hypothetical protein